MNGYTAQDGKVCPCQTSKVRLFLSLPRKSTAHTAIALVLHVCNRAGVFIYHCPNHVRYRIHKHYTYSSLEKNNNYPIIVTGTAEPFCFSVPYFQLVTHYIVVKIPTLTSPTLYVILLQSQAIRMRVSSNAKLNLTLLNATRNKSQDGRYMSICCISPTENQACNFAMPLTPRESVIPL